MSEVLVTGGLGFIGSHLTEQLVDRGHEVTIIDNLSHGTRDNIAAVADRVKVLESDLLDNRAVAEAARNKDCVLRHRDGCLCG